MHRIDGPGATVDKKFTEGDPAGGVQATVVTDDWLNDIQENLMGLLAESSIAPVKGDYTQLALAIQAIASAGAAITGAFKNFKASATGTSAPIAITADEVVVKNSSNVTKVLRGVSLSVTLTVSGANGLDTGTSAASTWYYLYVIWNPTTLSAAGLLSLSATAPTLPSGYTYFARVGTIRTDATGNKYPLSFVKINTSMQLKVVAGSNVAALPALASGVAGTITTPPAWVAVPLGNLVSPVATRIKLYASNGTATAGTLIAAPNNAYAGTVTGTPPPLMLSNVGSSPNSVYGDFLIESSNIYWANSSGAAALFLFGWEE
jgi:hypothetical protein